MGVCVPLLEDEDAAVVVLSSWGVDAARLVMNGWFRGVAG